MKLNDKLASAYHSGSQKARVLTESWIGENLFCPRCGNNHIQHFTNNRPVADFFCSACGSQYELKSRQGIFKNKIADGAYDTLIARITSNENPDFLFMSYSMEKMCVMDLVMIPKSFFVPEVIEKRKPLSLTARRAGWIGCNILIDQIPQQGRIAIVSGGIEEKRERVFEKVALSENLSTDNLYARGWLMDVLKCVNSIPINEFSLNEMYQFEKYLFEKHPENNNIRPKIRQQLQFLRDKGVIEFLGKGKYRKMR